MKIEHNYPEKYRPKTVSECILPDNIKSSFQSFVDDGNIPMLLLTGGHGLGKTTIAKAMCDELGVDMMFINASLKGGIDLIRTRIIDFASTVSLSGSTNKVIILDEADGLTPDAQRAIKSTLEEFSSNCSFIFTANHKNKIIEPIHSRCINVDFVFRKEDHKILMSQFMKRIQIILDKENVEYDNPVLAQLIKTFFPDFRRTLNELQRYAIGGKIDSGILVNISEIKIDKIVTLVRHKKFGELRKWLGENSDIIDFSNFYTVLYKSFNNFLVPSSIPTAVILTGKWQYRSAFSLDKEINVMAYLTELMNSCEFLQE